MHLRDQLKQSNLKNIICSGCKLPLIWVPKSNFITSSYCNTVVSPEFGVQWAAILFKYSLGISNQTQQYVGKSSSNENYQFNEHPVGNAMPASNPFSAINLRTVFSNVSHSSVIGIPGFMMPFIYFLTCRYAGSEGRHTLHYISRHYFTVHNSNTNANHLISLFF